MTGATTAGVSDVVCEAHVMRTYTNHAIVTQATHVTLMSHTHTENQPATWLSRLSPAPSVVSPSRQTLEPPSTDYSHVNDSISYWIRGVSTPADMSRLLAGRTAIGRRCCFGTTAKEKIHTNTDPRENNDTVLRHQDTVLLSAGNTLDDSSEYNSTPLPIVHGPYQEHGGREVEG